jgi:hypothetical protein
MSQELTGDLKGVGTCLKVAIPWGRSRTFTKARAAIRAALTGAVALATVFAFGAAPDARASISGNAAELAQTGLSAAAAAANGAAAVAGALPTVKLPVAPTAPSPGLGAVSGAPAVAAVGVPSGAVPLPPTSPSSPAASPAPSKSPPSVSSGAASTSLPFPASLLGVLTPAGVDLAGIPSAGVDPGIDPLAPGAPTSGSADPAWPLGAGDTAVLGVAPLAPGTAALGGAAAGTPPRGALNALLQALLGAAIPQAQSDAATGAQSDTAGGARAGTRWSGGSVLLVPGRRASGRGWSGVGAWATRGAAVALGAGRSFRAILASGPVPHAGYRRPRGARRALAPAAPSADESRPIFIPPLSTTSGAAATAGSGIGLGATAVVLLGVLALWMLQFFSARISLDEAAWRSALLALRLERPG